MNSDVAARAAVEASFWDRQASRAGGFRLLFYDEVNEEIRRQMRHALGSLAGKRALFLGCGTSAGMAAELAGAGADVWCLDISSVSISQLREHDFGELASRIHPIVGDAERTPFRDGFFDVVVGRAILHHLDLAPAMAEMLRVCRKGALIVFSEPLDGNPAIRLFRRLTPLSRVATEHPFTRGDLRRIAGYCSPFSTRTNFLLALAAVPLFMFRLKRLGRAVFRLGCAADRALFALLPLFRRWAWNVTIAANLKDRGRRERPNPCH